MDDRTVTRAEGGPAIPSKTAAVERTPPRREYRDPITCPDCRGDLDCSSCSDPGNGRCSACDGTKRTRIDPLHGDRRDQGPCPQCLGTGECTACDGTGGCLTCEGAGEIVAIPHWRGPSA